MENAHKCLREEEWGELHATLKFVKEELLIHVVEGDKPGGFRDRLKDVEARVCMLIKEIELIKRSYWKACFVAGIIGGLLGKVTPEFFALFVKMIGG